MFFERNKKLLIGAGAVALLWVILYFVLVSPAKQDARDKQEQALKDKKSWEDYTDNAKEHKSAKGRNNEWLARVTAERELKESSAQTEEKFKELGQIEFGTHETLKAFSTAAAGARGDVGEMLNRKIKEASARARIVLKNNSIHDNLFSQNFGEASEPLKLLRLAMIDRFLSVCKDVKDTATGECKISEIKQVDYSPPYAIPAPTEKKEEADELDDEAVAAKKKKGKEKDTAKADTFDRLVQIPMKVLLRIPAENYTNQLLCELQKPTPLQQSGEDQHGYFCVRGFHIAARDNAANAVELCVAVSALLRESEVAALGIKLGKDEGAGKAKDDW